MASTALSTAPKAVIIMTGVSGDCFLTALKTSMPLMPLIFISVMTRLGARASKMARPSSPDDAERTSYPSSWRLYSRMRRNDVSSSIIRIFIAIACPIVSVLFFLLHSRENSRGDRNNKDCPSGGICCHLYPALMSFDNFFRNCKPQACPISLGGKKRGENLWLKIFRNTGPGVPKNNLDFRIFLFKIHHPLRFNRQGVAAGRRLNPVKNNIKKSLMEFIPVSHNLQSFIGFQLQTNALISRFRHDEHHDATQLLANITRLH